MMTTGTCCVSRFARRSAAWLCAALLGSCAVSRPAPPPGAAAFDLSNAADISADFETLRQKFGIPALAGAAAKKGRLVRIGAAGVRTAGAPEKVTVNDLWHLGSCTKAMTATLIAILVDRGKLKWTTTIGETFPELRKTIRTEFHDVTIEQLLLYRAGNPGTPPEVWQEFFSGGESPRDQRMRVVRVTLALPPLFPPGIEKRYSNEGYAIAGAMAERVMNRPWEDLMRDELFLPLGMASAGFGAPGRPEVDDQPRGHQVQETLSVPVEPGPGADNPPAIGPAATVHCSLVDWLKFACMHLEGAKGGSVFLTTETFRKLHTPPAGDDYALGWIAAANLQKGELTLLHSGSNTMWFCTIFILKHNDLAIVVAANQADERAQSACQEALGGLIVQAEFRAMEGPSPSNRGYLGVTLKTGEDGQECVVTGVQPGTAAERAGVRVGDVILAVGGSPVAGAEEARAAIGGRVAGQKAEFRIKREHTELKLTAELGAWPKP